MESSLMQEKKLSLYKKKKCLTQSGEMHVSFISQLTAAHKMS